MSDPRRFYVQLSGLTPFYSISDLERRSGQSLAGAQRTGGGLKISHLTRGEAEALARSLNGLELIDFQTVDAEGRNLRLYIRADVGEESSSILGMTRFGFESPRRSPLSPQQPSGGLPQLPSFPVERPRTLMTDEAAASLLRTGIPNLSIRQIPHVRPTPVSLYHVRVTGIPFYGFGQSDVIRQWVGFPINNTYSTPDFFDINNLTREQAEQAVRSIHNRLYPETNNRLTATIREGESAYADSQAGGSNPPSVISEIPMSRSPVRSFQSPRMTQGPEGSNLVLVTNLNPSTRRGDLEDLFGRYGRLNRIETNPSAGTARIFFADPRDAVDAVRDLNERDLDGRRIQVSVSQEGISSRRYILVNEASRLIQSGRIIQSIVDPENQQEVPAGLTRVTLIGIDGQEYDVLARYDPRTNQIYPPQ